MQGLIAKKIGMTRVFDDAGRHVAVTVLEAGPCTVIQCKSGERDGYEAVQLGFGDRKEKRATKPEIGHCKKANVTAKRVLKEFSAEQGDELKMGDTITTAIFEGVSHVDITGTTKGRGFQGAVKRHRMAGGRMTHGGHSKRRIGSIGQCSYPARVAKGKRMPGHMGAVTVTQQNLRIVEIRGDDGLLFIEGAVPGANGSIVMVRKALKKGRTA